MIPCRPPVPVSHPLALVVWSCVPPVLGFHLLFSEAPILWFCDVFSDLSCGRLSWECGLLLRGHSGSVGLSLRDLGSVVPRGLCDVPFGLCASRSGIAFAPSFLRSCLAMASSEAAESSPSETLRVLVCGCLKLALFSRVATRRFFRSVDDLARSVGAPGLDLAARVLVLCLFR